MIESSKVEHFNINKCTSYEFRNSLLNYRSKWANGIAGKRLLASNLHVIDFRSYRQ